MSDNDADYQRRVAAALEAALRRTTHTQPFDLRRDRLIIFSDQHRGARNGADDFLRSERAYNAAMAYYFAMGHTLVVLGDADELWEEFPWAVTRAYPHTLSLEAQFHTAGRYLRVWGNHDDDWSFPDNVQLFLKPFFGERLPIHESVRVAVKAGEAELGTLFLTHGHQGDMASDHWAWLSRWIVRFVWRPFQRLTRISLNTPARNWQLREKHNIALYRWAEQQSKTVLIAGHTHRPVFRSQTETEQLRQVLDSLRTKAMHAPDDERLRAVASGKAAELEWSRAQDFYSPGNEGEVVPMDKPCYFNTGCCSYLDGDITGIELAEGEIRLVRWPDHNRRPRPQTLAAASLREVLAAC
jgi:predicted phosphodiesterase